MREVKGTEERMIHGLVVALFYFCPPCSLIRPTFFERLRCVLKPSVEVNSDLCLSFLSHCTELKVSTSLHAAWLSRAVLSSAILRRNYSFCCCTVLLPQIIVIDLTDHTCKSSPFFIYLFFSFILFVSDSGIHWHY